MPLYLVNEPIKHAREVPTCMPGEFVNLPASIGDDQVAAGRLSLAQEISGDGTGEAEPPLEEGEQTERVAKATGKRARKAG